MLNSLSFLNNEVSLSTNPSQLNTHELVILDAGVENIQQLIEGIKPEIDWVVMNRNQDGIEQITRILANHPDITTLHIISHGAPGCLFLGNTQLTLETLESYTTQLQSWFAASPPSSQHWGSKDSQSAIVQSPLLFKVPNIGDSGYKEPSILLYGCKVAAGDAGAECIRKLHDLTGANIAAAQTPTGNASWDLDVTLGPIAPKLALNAETQATYTGVLGVKLIKDINPGSVTSSPERFTIFENKLLFKADDGTYGKELWISDGTQAGTKLLKDINPGSDSASFNLFTVFDNKVFFWANDVTHGYEMWVSNGTQAGTELFKDINPGSSNSLPSYFTVFGDKLFFQAKDGTHGYEMWVSDGTQVGTHIKSG